MLENVIFAPQYWLHNVAKGREDICWFSYIGSGI